MANPYQTPNESPVQDRLKKSGETTELREFLYSLIVFLMVGVMLFGIGKSAVPFIDEQSRINFPLYIYMAIFFVTFLAQPMNQIGFVICDIFSCVIWGWAAVKLCKSFDLIPAHSRPDAN